MGKVEEGLKIYPKGVFYVSDISRELEETDLVGTRLTGDELNDNYYLSKRHPFIFIQESFGIVHPLGTTILNPYSLW